MRKYQQLLLLIISIISVTVLLIYKSENNRLKYVLEVVNFFGRNDANALIKIEGLGGKNTSYYFDYSSPLPLWQNLGNNFYSYSSFWKKNPHVAGLETTTLVVGSLHSIVNFNCQIKFQGQVVAGKFMFSRIDTVDDSVPIHITEKFVMYKFLCKTNRDFKQPSHIIFTDLESKSEHVVPLRNLDIKSKLNIDKSLVTVCVDLNSYNGTYQDSFINDTTFIQYFLHYELIGIRNFIIYNSNVNQLNQYMVDLINTRYGIKLNVLPYNFPFELTSRLKNRAIIETDCLMRTSGTTKYVILTSLNEYLYPSQRLSQTNPLIRLINRYSNDINKFEIKSRSVCLDQRRKILSDNNLYNIDIKTPDIFYIFKNEYPYNDKLINENNKKSIEIDRNIAILHRYMVCSNKTELYDWRSSTDKEFLSYIDLIARELNTLIFH